MGRTKRKDHRGFHPRSRYLSGIAPKPVEDEFYKYDEFEPSDEAFFDTDDRPSNYPHDTPDDREQETTDDLDIEDEK